MKKRTLRQAEQAIRLAAIGIIHTPHKETGGMPIQPVYAEDARGTIEVFPAYADGLRDLEGFDRLWLIYSFHQAGPARLRVVPFRDTVERGVFATRAPCRPNAIGMSCVRLLSVAGNVLTVAGVDILDGTPLLDIKPYVPEFDAHPQSRAGWLVNPATDRKQADNRFGA